MIYFTADMHFGHKAIMRMQNRPFESVEEMDKKISKSHTCRRICFLYSRSYRCDTREIFSRDIFQSGSDYR